jgi:glucokinase
LINEPAIVALAREIDPHIGEGAERPILDVFDSARAGNGAMRCMLEERARFAGIALANLVNVLNPELILLSGLLYEGYDLMHPVIEATMRKHSFGGLGNKVQVLPTTFGLHSAEIGAASLAFDSFFLESTNHG